MKRWISIGTLLLVFLVGCSEPEQVRNPSEITVTASPGITTRLTPSPTFTVVPTVTPTIDPTPTPSPTPDVEAPLLTLLGEAAIEVIARTEYVEPGFSAIDNCDGDVTELVQVLGEVDVNWCGTYTRIYEAGHTVGIHCKSHDYNVVYASEEAYFEDLFAMQDLIYECTGVRTTLVRFPGGSSNMSSSFNPGIMTRLTAQLEQRGFQYFDWNVSSGDSGGFYCVGIGKRLHFSGVRQYKSKSSSFYK